MDLKQLEYTTEQLRSAALSSPRRDSEFVCSRENVNGRASVFGHMRVPAVAVIALNCIDKSWRLDHNPASFIA
jgi:hypothetical protein